jgi:hypothetical protein
MLVSIENIEIVGPDRFRLELFDTIGNGVVRPYVVDAETLLDYDKLVRSLESSGIERVTAAGDFHGISHGKFRTSWDTNLEVFQAVVADAKKPGT